MAPLRFAPSIFRKTGTNSKQAQRRLKFEELFSVQIMLAQLRRRRIVHAGPRFEAPGAHMRQFLQDGLPFELTGAQRSALKDIARDMRGGKQMRRLLQGDVGSGKTVVAVAAMLHALDSGYQSAFMAPTEILAEQHYANLRKYLDPLGVRLRLLVGGLPKAEREQILADIAEGQASIAVGTHALIQEDVAFHGGWVWRSSTNNTGSESCSAPACSKWVRARTCCS